MAKSKETFSKKEKEKKKHKQKLDKLQRTADRKANKKNGNSLDDMMAYIDENGNLSDTPPDASRKKTFKLEDIQINVTPQDHSQKDEYRTGTVTFFNTAKGFGFINDHVSQERLFFHISEMMEPIAESDKVRFQAERGPRGMNAIQVTKIS